MKRGTAIEFLTCTYRHSFGGNGEIQAVLVTIRRELGIALIVVEQHLDFAWSIADRYYVMQRGKIVTAGATAMNTPAEILSLLSV